ncbi:hypothetical protein BDZ91DRAFT_853086 [Kalaharituber pfeilii]|nr:hypothetical protein BDZ91DRAFT_853086 [Kalaharituber pfeilii]
MHNNTTATLDPLHMTPSEHLSPKQVNALRYPAHAQAPNPFGPLMYNAQRAYRYALSLAQKVDVFVEEGNNWVAELGGCACAVSGYGCGYGYDIKQHGESETGLDEDVEIEIEEAKRAFQHLLPRALHSQLHSILSLPPALYPLLLLLPTIVLSILFFITIYMPYNFMKVLLYRIYDILGFTTPFIASWAFKFLNICIIHWGVYHHCAWEEDRLRGDLQKMVRWARREWEGVDLVVERERARELKDWFCARNPRWATAVDWVEGIWTRYCQWGKEGEGGGMLKAKHKAKIQVQGQDAGSKAFLTMVKEKREIELDKNDSTAGDAVADAGEKKYAFITFQKWYEMKNEKLKLKKLERLRKDSKNKGTRSTRSGPDVGLETSINEGCIGGYGYRKASQMKRENRNRLENDVRVEETPHDYQQSSYFGVKKAQNASYGFTKSTKKNQLDARLQLNREITSQPMNNNHNDITTNVSGIFTNGNGKLFKNGGTHEPTPVDFSALPGPPLPSIEEFENIKHTALFKVVEKKVRVMGEWVTEMNERKKRREVVEWKREGKRKKSEWRNVFAKREATGEDRKSLNKNMARENKNSECRGGFKIVKTSEKKLRNEEQGNLVHIKEKKTKPRLTLTTVRTQTEDNSARMESKSIKKTERETIPAPDSYIHLDPKSKGTEAQKSVRQEPVDFLQGLDQRKAQKREFVEMMKKRRGRTSADCSLKLGSISMNMEAQSSSASQTGKVHNGEPTLFARPTVKSMAVIQEGDIEYLDTGLTKALRKADQHKGSAAVPLPSSKSSLSAAIYDTQSSTQHTISRPMASFCRYRTTAPKINPMIAMERQIREQKKTEPQKFKQSKKSKLNERLLWMVSRRDRMAMKNEELEEEYRRRKMMEQEEGIADAGAE